MPVDRLRTALEKLVALGLVHSDVGDDFTTYEITAQGQEFLTSYWKMKAFTDLFEQRWPPP
jgi:predicted transcriptional regulator